MTAAVGSGPGARAPDASAPGRRTLEAALAACGIVVAGYLAAHQVGAIGAIWDPVFGSASSSAVVDSSLARSLPVPDAALGVVAYLVEAILALAGPRDRSSSMPWLVALFGLVALGLAVTALGLVATQAFVVRAWCSACLLSAAISLVTFALALPEVAAAISTITHSTGKEDAGSAAERPSAETRTTPMSNDTHDTSIQPTTSSSDGHAAGTGSAGSSSSQGSATGGSASGSTATMTRSNGNGQARPTRVVVVTGSSAGVGRATAIAFAKEGAAVALLARGRDGLEGARRDVEAAGGFALPIQTDMADADAVERAAQRVEETYGPIDVWVNVAMVSVFSPAKEMQPDEYKRVTDVAYLGYVYGTLAALKRMLPRDRGRIIQVGSALAYRGIPLQSAYCGAKHAIQGFTESVRCELIHDGSNVKISMAQLPAVNTPQFDWVKSRLPHRAQPVPPIFQPEVIADALVFLSHHYRRELNIGGSTDLAIYANRIVPGWLDYYLGWTGYDSQQTDQPRNPNAPNNLYQPVDGDGGGDHGAHGRFDDRASSSSRQLWAAEHRGLLAGAIGTAAVGAFALLRRVR